MCIRDRLQYVTGSSTSPSGLSGNYPFIHKGNAFDGTWTTDSTSQFKVLGDGGSIAITTNDGGGNCNVCFNHANEIPDTNGSSWRIRADIDAVNSHFYIQNAKSVTSISWEEISKPSTKDAVETSKPVDKVYS